MAEGIGSISDLKIVVDAETAVFKGRLDEARATVATFATEGSTLLKAFDGTVGKLATTADSVKGRVEALQKSISAMSAGMAPHIATVLKIAEVAGVDADVKALGSAVSDLGEATKTAASIGWNALIERMKEFSGQANLVKGETAGVTDEVGKLHQRVQETARTRLNDFTAQVKDGTAALTAMSEGIGALSSDQVSLRIKQLDTHIAALGAQLRPGYQPGFLDQLLGNDAHAAAELISNLRLSLQNMRRELESRLSTNWTTELVWADMDKFVESAKRANDQLKIQNETLGMSKSRAAEHMAIRNAELEAKRQDQAISPDSRKQIEDEAAETRRQIQRREDHAESLRAASEATKRQDQQEKAVDRVDQTIERDVEALQAKARALTMNSDAAIEATYAEKLFSEARRAGLELSDRDVESLNEAARAYAGLTRAVKQLEDQQRMLGETSQAVSSGILNEFAAWTRGGEFNVRRMTASILVDLAKITLQRSVLGPLFGGGGSDGGGLLGSALASLFGGGGSGSAHHLPALAAGGPMDAGRAYLVGEEGPEIVLPRHAGYVVPADDSRRMLAGMTLGRAAPAGAGASSSGGNGGTFAPVVSLTIDARGATVDAIARLEQLKAELPHIILGTMTDARQRGMA